MKFYPHHISDFNNATRHLTRVERSVYRDAIELYYDTESVLTSDVNKLAKRLMCSTNEELDALNMVLEEFFILHGDGYFHSRCDEEIEKYRSNVSAKARAGKASAKARQQKTAERKQKTTKHQQSATSAEQNLTRVHNQEPITNNQEPIIKKPMSGKPDLSNHVAEIFEHWKSTMSKSGSAKLTSERATKIRARLSDGYTVEQIKSAIDGCAKSPHHMGRNDSGTVYDDLTLICRNGEKLEWFMNNIAKFDGGENETGRYNRKLSCAEQQIADARELAAIIAARENHGGAMGADGPDVPQQMDGARGASNGEWEGVDQLQDMDAEAFASYPRANLPRGRTL